MTDIVHDHVRMANCLPRHLRQIRIRTVQPMFVYEAMSRRPISTNMLARTGSRKRSEMRVARWLPIEMPGKEPSSRALTMYQSTLPMSQWPRPATRVRGTACARSEPTMRTGGSRG